MKMQKQLSGKQMFAGPSRDNGGTEMNSSKRFCWFHPYLHTSSIQAIYGDHPEKA